MKILTELPPNIGRINQFLTPPEEAVFAYGDTIYNPLNIDIWPDIEAHEEAHQRQQEKFGSVELWWEKYLQDKDFRLDQEVEAYAVQLQFLKDKGANDKMVKHFLWEFAKALSNQYNIRIDYSDAETKIRKYAGN